MNLKVIIFVVYLYLLHFTRVLCDSEKVRYNLFGRHVEDKEIVVSERGCSYRVSWQIHGEEINFSLRTTVAAPQTALWIAVGLSATQYMPDTTFAACWSTSEGTIQLKHGKTVDYNGVLISNQSDVRLLEGEWKDNELFCNFSWNLDIEKQNYLILATGLLSGKGDSMLKHTNRPSVSPWQQGNNGNGEVAMSCDCFPTWKEAVIRIHGMIMGLAFLLLLPTGIVTARYYRSTFTARQWFKVHTRLMVTAVCGVILALVLALIHTDGALHMGIHQIFGIVVIIFVLLQPLVALCRPHADPLDFRRKVFNIFHRTLGLSVLTGGVVQCFLGVYILSVQSNGVLYGLLVMSVTGHGIFIVLYEYIRYRLSHRAAVARYSKVVMEDDNSDIEEVAFMDTSRSPTPPKTSTNPYSPHSSLHMNVAYYMYILQAFTIAGLFNAFLFYEIP